MDKRKLDQLEKLVNKKTGKQDQPPPGFFSKKDTEGIANHRENLLRQGYSLEAVNRCPIYIEG